MSHLERSRTVALLIDYDNLQICAQRDAPGSELDLRSVVALAQRYGSVVVARAYAEWNNPNERLEAYKVGIEPSFAPVLRTEGPSGRDGKSLADTVMVADGVDLMWTHAPDVFVLVTSDKDLIPLARLVKQRGARVVVLGSDLTAVPLREIADEFYTYRRLVQEMTGLVLGGPTSSRSVAGRPPRPRPAQVERPAPAAQKAGPAPEERPATAEGAPAIAEAPMEERVAALPSSRRRRRRGRGRSRAAVTAPLEPAAEAALVVTDEIAANGLESAGLPQVEEESTSPPSAAEPPIQPEASAEAIHPADQAPPIAEAAPPAAPAAPRRRRRTNRAAASPG